jgi:hypothetical protein
MEEKNELNLIKVGTYTRVNGVLRFANVLLKERNFRDIHFRALGASIGKLVSVVELLKLTHPGMYQVNTIGTVAFQLKESEEEVMNERLYPKLEIVLSLDPPQNKGIGYQDKMTEEERIRLCGIMEKGMGGSFGRGRGRGIGLRGRGNRGGSPRRGRGFGPSRYFEEGEGSFGGEERGYGYGGYSGEERGYGYGGRSNRGRGFGRGSERGRSFGTRGRRFTPRGYRSKGLVF